MKLNVRPIAALASIVFAVAVASAQNMPSAPYLTVAQRSTFLLANPFDVNKLGLSATQTQAVKKAIATYSAKQSKLLALKEPSMQDEAANDKAYAVACLKLLTQAQADKLLSIGVREIGTDALQDPGICAKIGLGSTIVRKIGEISAAYNKRAENVDAMVGAAIEKIPEPKAGADRTEYDKKQKEIIDSYQGERNRLQKEKADADKSILALMSANQKEKWIALAGAPDVKSPKH